MKEINLEDINLSKLNEINEDWRIRPTRIGEKIGNDDYGYSAGIVFEIKVKKWYFVSGDTDITKLIQKSLIKLHNNGYIDLNNSLTK